MVSKSSELDKAEDRTGWSIRTRLRLVTESAVDPAVEADLEAARHLVRYGVPVFVARPALRLDGTWDPHGGTGKTGYVIPAGWQHTVADPAVVDTWRPGDALCAVMGHGIDLLDNDPRNGGAESLAVLAGAGAMPRSYGRATTPSGGTHDFIASLGVRSRDGVLPGLDVKAGLPDGTGRGFTFLAPTLKVSKATGEISAYAYEMRPDLSALHEGDDTGHGLADRIAAGREARAVPPRAAVTGTTVTGTRRTAWASAAVEGVLADLRGSRAWPQGYRDERERGWQKVTADAAYRLGALIRMEGSGLDLDAVRRAFIAAAPRGGGADERWAAAIWEAQWRRAQPAQPPPDTAAAVAAAFINQHPASTTAAPSNQEQPVDDAQQKTPEPLWQQLQREYPVLGMQRPPRERIFEVVEDSNGNPKVTGSLLVESVARYIDQGFADGGDRRTHVYRDGVYTADDVEVMRRTAWVLGEQYTRARHGAVSDVVSTLPRPALPDVPDARFINCRNGMVEVTSGELLPHDPSYLSSVQLPVDYAPEATCPRFDAWLAQVLPADTVAMFWEVLGYLLLHGNPLQIAVLLHGSGGNGKGTLLRVLHRLLGRHNISAVTLAEITEGKFETAGIYGKQANIAGDIDARYLKNTARFKAITGGDVINAQHKNAKPFEFTCWAVPIFSANELWRSSDVSRGYFRRWVPIPFPRSVVESEEPFDEEVLYAETAGIFAKALPALWTLLNRGRFELSASSRALLTAFEEQADSVLSWMGEDDWLTTHRPGAECWTARTKLHARYRTWCIDSGHVALSSTKFYARLDALGYEPTKREGTRGYAGLALLAL